MQLRLVGVDSERRVEAVQSAVRSFDLVERSGTLLCFVSQQSRLSFGPRQHVMFVQRAHAFLARTNGDSFFTAVTSGANRFVSAGQILVTELGHVEMSFGRCIRDLGSSRVLLNRAQRSGMDGSGKTFLAAAAAG